MATGRRGSRAILYIAFILILVLVLILVVVKFNPLTNNQASQNNGQPAAAPATQAPTVESTVEIVKLSQDIRRGQLIKDEILTLDRIPRKDFVEGGYFTDKKVLAGARAKYDLKAGTPLTSALVLPVGSTSSVPSFDIPAGKVAISVPISKLSSVAYGLQKGDHVNVIVSLLMVDMDTNFQSKLPNRTGIVIAPGPVTQNQTYVTALVHSPEGYEVKSGDAYSYLGRIEIDPTMNNPVYLLPAEAQRPRLVSQTLIQDVVILQLGTFEKQAASIDTISAPNVQQPAAGPTPTRAPQAQTRQTPVAPTTDIIPDVVTLIVSPQDAVTLNYLMLAGANLNMVLRSAGDQDVKNTEAVTLQFIMDQYQIPNPAKLPYGMEPRLDSFPSFVQPFPDVAAGPTPTPTK
jgi:Flp pilus assembly protein CpaB